MPSSKRTKSRLAAEPTLQSREITRDELARLIGSLPPDVRITIEFHVRSGNPVLTDPEKPLTIAQAAEALNVSRPRSCGWRGSYGWNSRARADVRSNASQPKACGDSAMPPITRHRRVHARIA